MTVPDNVKPIGQYDAYIHAMIVAAPGFGKTVWCGTAPNALFLTTDPEGTISALAFGSQAKEWMINVGSDMSDAYRYLRDGGIKEMGLEWVVIDNTGEAKNLFMAESMANGRRNNPRRDEFVPSLDDHQRSQLQIKAFIKQMHDLPVNVLWTAWRKSETDSDGDDYFTCGVHGQQGQIAQEVQGLMNVVGFGEVDDEGNRVIYFKQEKPFMGKDRYNALPKIAKVSDKPMTEGFNVAKMQSTIEAAKKKYAAQRRANTAATRRPASAAKKTASTPARRPASRRSK